MPLDIRNFFGAVPKKDKKKVAPAAADEADTGDGGGGSTEISAADFYGNAKANSSSSAKVDTKKHRKTTDKETITSKEEEEAFTASLPSNPNGHSSSRRLRATSPRQAAAVANAKIAKMENAEDEYDEMVMDDAIGVIPAAAASSSSSSPVAAKRKSSENATVQLRDVDGDDKEMRVASPRKRIKSATAAPPPPTPDGLASSAAPPPAKKFVVTKTTPPPSQKRRSAAAAAVTAAPQAVVVVVNPATLAPLDAFDVPAAPLGCLDNITVVFTGVDNNDVVSRETATDWIKTLGGRVTTGVSGKTDYLVVLGDTLEDGRPYIDGGKYKKAVELDKPVVVGVPRLYALLDAYAQRQNTVSSTATTDAAAPAAAASVATTSTTTPTNGSVATASSKPMNPYAAGAANPYAKKAPPATTNPYARKNPYAKTAAVAAPPAVAVSLAAPAVPPKGDNNNPNGLWVDRYKPTSTSDILGNQDAVKKLTTWLQRWEATFNKDHLVGKAFSAPQGPWKAALLSGPPGIGKTTTATLVAYENGRDVLEFNASDVRSKKALQEELGDIGGSSTLHFGGKNGQTKKRRVIIMDEVDGMGAGDRSGLAELIQLIKKTRVPIICICNDRQSQKMKSLLPYCLDLRYRRPVKTQIAQRAVEVARREGLMVEQNAAEAVAESCGNDVRQVLNCLQMWASNNANTSMTYKSLKEREHEMNKDEVLRVGLFDAARVILEGRRGLSGGSTVQEERTHFFKRNDAFFVDYNFTGLLVQQNYLKVLQGQFTDAKRTNEADKMASVLDRMACAAESLSDYAHAENGLRGGQNWSLLPFTGLLTVKTGFHAGGPTGGFLPGYPEFTSWLGKNSTKGKKLRLVSELQHHMNYHISGGPQQMRLSYLPALRDRLLSLLVTSKDDDDESTVQAAIDLMDEYGLDRDDVMEKLDEFSIDATAKSVNFGKMDSKRKRTFTTRYNEGVHKSQALVADQGAAAGKAKRGGGGVTDTVDPDAIDDDAVKEEEEDKNDDDDDPEKIKALFKRKGRGKKKAAPRTAASKAKKKK